MPEETQTCPKCGRECHRDSVDVGVGVIYGPWGCECGWSESEEYDLLTNNPGLDAQGGFTDQYGVYYPPSNIRAILERVTETQIAVYKPKVHRWDYPNPINLWEKWPWWFRWPVAIAVACYFGGSILITTFYMWRNW